VRLCCIVGLQYILILISLSTNSREKSSS
jgi:hypothetical protein